MSLVRSLRDTKSILGGTREPEGSEEPKGMGRECVNRKEVSTRSPGLCGSLLLWKPSVEAEYSVELAQ